MWPNRCVLAWGLTVVGFAVLPAPVRADPVTASFSIQVDTYLDSRDPTHNYGVSTTAKVVVNGVDGSLCRVLFRLPDAVLAIPPERVVLAKVWFYVWFDQTESRNVRLHPLKTCFAEGSGDNTVSGDGATWLTSDGVTAWPAAGGDYDPLVFLDAVKSPNWFSWDITAISQNQDLRGCGAMLRMNDESPIGAEDMPRAPFTSSDGPLSQRPYVEVTYLPQPALCDEHVVWADADGDGDVDQEDFGVFQACFSGPGHTYPVDPAWCQCLDRDGDGHIDVDDLEAWEKCLVGPSIPWSSLLAPDCTVD